MRRLPQQPRIRRPFCRPALAVAIATALSVAVLPWRALAAEPAAGFECRWAAGPIKIDGLADEPDWQQAQLIDSFTLPWLGAKTRPSRTPTKAKLLWDRDNIYFFAEMEDADLYADVKEHDGQCWDNDVFELFFKPDDKQPGYYEFQANALGTKLDMFLPRRGAGGYPRFKADGEFHMRVAVKLRGSLNDWRDKDQGWSVEGSIAWKDFLRTGGRPEAGDFWKFALCRYDYSVDFEGPELSSCAPLTVANFHHWEDYAPLKFVGPDPQRGASRERPVGIQRLIPWTDSKVVGSPDPPPPYRVRRTFENLKIPCPMAVYAEPGTEDLIVIHQLFAWSGAGRIVRIHDVPQTTEGDELLKVDGIAYGLAFHPDYQNNGYVYVGSNGPLSSKPKSTRITRYTIDRQAPRHFVPDSAKVIIEWPSDGHNGGDLAFGNDGLLYISSGDGTSDSDVNLRGQDITQLTAKVLRIDVDHPDAGRNYSVPQDNPFIGAAGARPETWAFGLRNPWRLTYDRKTGQLWVGNNGQDLWEQVYFIRRGENYGWSIVEGSHPFYADRKQGPAPLARPAAEHPHSDARSLTGGIVYHGSALPELDGAYIYGDWSTGKIWSVRWDGQQPVGHQELTDTTLQISGFGTDTHGEMLVVDHGGGFYRLERTPADLPRPPFPRRLSETGVFQSVRGHQVHPALIPYSVNAPLWSDGAYKERYLGIPDPDQDRRRIDFTLSRGWNFPNGTVLVKSFALETEAGNPASRRWIETRLLTRQEGEWVGYSYAWNDEQTEAELVSGSGADREYVVQDSAAGGTHKQSWHYPSRAECMVCHSRAANYVLGLSTLQMNKLHEYGSVQANQLRTLEHIGLLRVDWRAEAVNSLRDEASDRNLTKAEVDAWVRRQAGTREKLEPAWSAMLFREPEEYGRLADPADPHAPLDRRARSYLHANCAHCHVEAGGGNAQFNVEYTASADRTNLFDARPLHHTFGIARPALVARGAADNSVLYRRIALRGAGQMPPLASAVVDEQAVHLIHDWIDSLRPGQDGANAEARPQRIVALGDSITEGHTYPLLVQASLRAAGKPAPTIINAGIGGDTAAGMLARLERDVIARRASRVIVSAGINDLHQHVPLSDYLASMGKIADVLTARGAQLLILTTTGVRDGARQQTLDEWNAALRELAKEKGLPIGDVAAAFARARSTGEDLWEPDGTHLNFAGYRVMAAAVLEGLGFAGVPVVESLKREPMPGLISAWRVRQAPDNKPLSQGAAEDLEPDDSWQHYSLPEQEPQAAWWFDQERARGYALSLEKRLGKGGHYQASATIDSPGRRTVYFKPGGTIRALWLNGQRIYQPVPETLSWHMREEVEATLVPGTNKILAEVGPTFFLSIVDEKE